VRYLVAWVPPNDIAKSFPNLELVFSVGAGVDQFDTTKLPHHIPLVRMLEPGITERMVEYACMSVLALHRDLCSSSPSSASRSGASSRPRTRGSGVSA
jgi:glyoxylate/hydroxypyruvate reductase A